MKELTAAQEAKFPEYVNKWINIGLSTEDVDMERAKAAICKAYTNVGLKEPTQFYLVDSPIAAIELIQKLDPSLKKMDIFKNMCFGSHDAGWLGFYDFFNTETELKGEISIIEPFIELAKVCGWFNVFEDVVVFQQKPSLIKMDDQNRIHNETGPTISYRDGKVNIYAWHGVVIPDEWITEKEKLNPKIALTWKNIEQRRCACEILGWAKILKELKSSVIDTDGDPMIGTLLEVNIPDIGKEKFLQVLCGTGRTFAIPVPPTMKTALEANAWTFGIDKDLLKNLEVRT